MSQDLLVTKTYTLTTQVVQRIEKLAKRFELSKSEIVRNAIEEYYKTRESEL